MSKNHSYKIPSQGSTDWHIPLNQNFSQIDTDVEIRDVEDNRDQYASKADAKFLATDTGTRYLGDGSQWIEIPAQQRSLIAPQRTDDPTDASEGRVWFRTDTDELRIQTATGPVTLPAVDESAPTDAFLQLSFDDPAPETEKPYSDRDNSALREELLNRGFDGGLKDSGSMHADHGLDYFTAGTDPAKVYQGDASLAFYFMEGERMGAELPVSINRDDVWTQYYLKFEDGFDVTDDDYASWAQGGKLPGFNGPEYDKQEWKTLGYFKDPDHCSDGDYAPHNETGKIALAYYVYDTDVPIDEDGNRLDSGTSYCWTMNDAGIVDSGTWYELTCHTRVNDPGEANGLVEAWVDPLDGGGPTKAFERDQWELARESTGATIDIWRHTAFFGGGWTSPQDQHLYTDNLRFYADNPL